MRPPGAKPTRPLISSEGFSLPRPFVRQLAVSSSRTLFAIEQNRTDKRRAGSPEQLEEIARRQGPEGANYERALHDVWSVMVQLQE